MKTNSLIPMNKVLKNCWNNRIIWIKPFNLEQSIKIWINLMTWRLNGLRSQWICSYSTSQKEAKLASRSNSNTHRLVAPTFRIATQQKLFRSQHTLWTSLYVHQNTILRPLQRFWMNNTGLLLRQRGLRNCLVPTTCEAPRPSDRVEDLYVAGGGSAFKGESRMGQVLQRRHRR